MTSPAALLCLALSLPAAASNNGGHGSAEMDPNAAGHSQTQLTQPSGSGGSGGSGLTLSPSVLGLVGPGGITPVPKTVPQGGGAGSGGGGSQGLGGGTSGQGGQGGASKPGAIVSAPAAGHAVVGEGVDGGSLGAGHSFTMPDLPAPPGAASRESDTGSGPAGRAAGGANPLEKAVGQIAALPGARTPEQRRADALVQQANTQYTMGDHEGSLRTLEDAVRLDPENLRALVRRAQLENNLKRHADALADAQRALKLDARSPEAWDEAAWALFRSGRYREAADAATRALEADPNNSFALAIRARARWALGDKDGARADARAAAALDARFAQLAGAMADDSYKDDNDVVAEDAARAASPARRVPRWPPAALGGLLLAALAALATRRARSGAAKRPAAAAAAKTAFVDGRLAGKYELTRLIGQGGMGTVHEAFDHSLKRKVAVKKMADGLSEINPRAKELLLREAQTVAALHHPSVVDIYEIVEDGADLYLVFELVRGRTLAQVLAENGRLPLTRCAELLKPVCDALQFAHKRELVHRDLKPGNIMLSDDGQVKLMDFGIARPTGEGGAEPGRTPLKTAPTPEQPHLALTRTVMGTPLYMAPEMEYGAVSKEGDVYALGVCLYEMLTGLPPFADTASKLALRWTPPSALVPGLSHRVDQLLLRALQPDPAQRLRTPLAFWAALSAAVQPGSTPPDAAVLPAKS